MTVSIDPSLRNLTKSLSATALPYFIPTEKHLKKFEKTQCKVDLEGINSSITDPDPVGQQLYGQAGSQINVLILVKI
jgi:hypothetical protein